jgi:hypothetical protein
MHENPYAGCRNRWLKTQLHVHTTRSDGTEPVEMTLAHYRQLGYAAVAITDHDQPQLEPGLREGLVLLGGCERTDANRHIGEVGPLRIANHPWWNIDHWPVADLMRRPDLHGIEIYNGVVEHLPGAAECAFLWDQLLSTGRRCLGIAADDAHARQHRDLAWMMVDANPEPAAILAALAAGRSYASNGVVLREIGLDGDDLVVVADEPCEFRCLVERGALRHRSRGTAMRFGLREGYGYVRVEAVGAYGRRAWTSPLWLGDAASRTRLADHAVWFNRHLGL